LPLSFLNRNLFFNKSDKQLSVQIKKITGFYPNNLAGYKQSLRHHSVSQKIHHSGSKNSNERLEFLGDAVLNAIISEYIFKKYPYKDEGFLTQLRSKIVSRESLNNLAQKIGLSLLVEYDKKALQNVSLRNSIFGNALEAFIGAVFIDRGFTACKKFIIKVLLLHHLDIDKLEETETNFKGRLIEFCQKQNLQLDFESKETLENKLKLFRIKVLINRELLGVAEHSSKKKAEQMAAQKTFEILNNRKADSAKDSLA